MVINHFFMGGGLDFGDGDSRNPSHITYSQADLNYMAILKNICGQHFMREMNEKFNKEICIDTLRILSGHQTLKEMPHYDMLNYYLERLSELRRKMVTSLIRGKQFNRNQLLENTVK